jgi:hypothetical protein
LIIIIQEAMMIFGKKIIMSAVEALVTTYTIITLTKTQNIILDAKILGKIKKNMGITIQIAKNGSTLTQKNEQKFSSI